MHHRTPSSGVIGIGSTMRRRSSGATAYKHCVNDDSFPSSHSHPTVSPVSQSDDSPSSPVSLSLGQDRSLHLSTTEEDNGYHVYSSVAISDEVGEISFGPVAMPSSASNALPTSDLDASAISSPSSDASSSVYPANLIRSGDPHSGGNYQPLANANKDVSVESGHTGLILAIGTTDKFTQKWPKPKTMKYFEPHSKGIKYTTVGTTGPNDHTAAPSLEEGQGLALSLIAKWTPFKWCLLFSVMTVFAVGSAGLITAIMTWFNSITGTLLNSRPILAVYALLLWPAMLSLLAVGYTSYRRASLSLDHKLNFSWSRYYTPLGKRVIQDSLQCCGFYSSMHEASPSKRCYLRTPLPGCKAKLFEFERDNLKTIWRTVFSLAPLHLANMVVALLCANHITSTFGKGIIPKQYRLSPKDVKADADKILNGSGCDLSNSVIFREGADEQVTLRQKS